MNTNIILTMPAAQDHSTAALDTDTAIETGIDGAPEHAELAEKFDSILNNQLQEGKDEPSTEDTLKSLAGAAVEADPLAKPGTTTDLSSSKNTAVADDATALLDSESPIDPAALADPTKLVQHAILADPPARSNLLATSDEAAIPVASSADIELNATSLANTDENGPITAVNEQHQASTVAEEAKILLASNKIAGAETNLEEAKNGAHIELSSAAASKASPVAPIGLETQVTKSTRIVNNSPVAGSLATQADEVVLSSRQAVNVEEVSVTDSEQSQWSGKVAPPRGNTLPGNLPFLTNTDGKTALIENVSDLVNKAVFQNQQFSQSGEAKPTLQPLTQSEAAPTVFNVSSLINAEKAVTGRNPGAFNVENTSSFVVESPAGSTDWNNQVGDRIRWMGRVNIQSAELKLHPAELGTVEIKITTEDDQTKVSFLTGTTAAKEVIEASLPKLRDLLASSGLQLEQSDVSQKNLSENRTSQQDTNTGDNSDTNVVTEDTALLVRQNSLNQIDHYV